MTTQYQVLDEYTDGYLKARIESVLGEGYPDTDPFVVATWTLLSAPAEWRQSIVAAAYSRAHEEWNGSVYIVDDYFDTLRQEVSKFHGGHRPPWMESPLGEHDNSDEWIWNEWDH